jgi:shikimate kinase
MRIFLIGFMGSGKSYWGNHWAEKHGYEFYDLDELIERKEGNPVVDIFEEKGEDIFRLIEAKALRELTRYDNCIIACGGGTPCFHDNMKWINEKGFSVYLYGPATYLFDSIINEKDKRPLIKKVHEAELFFFIEQKLKERTPFYEQANLILNIEELTGETFKQILSALPAPPVS